MDEPRKDQMSKDIPVIRVRKGSDAPSMGEIKGMAPLASADSEGLSEVESSAETDHEGQCSDDITSPTLDVPYMKPKSHQHANEGDDITLHAHEDESLEDNAFHAADNDIENSADLEQSENTMTPVPSPTKVSSDVHLNSDDSYVQHEVVVSENSGIDDLPPVCDEPQQSSEVEHSYPLPPPPEEIQIGHYIQTDKSGFNTEEFSSNGAFGQESCNQQYPSTQTYGQEFASGEAYNQEYASSDSYYKENQPYAVGDSFEVCDVQDDKQSDADETNDHDEDIAAGYEQLENEDVESFNYQQYEFEEGGDDPFDLTYIEKKYSKDTLDTNSVERPRSTTPINLATLDDYLVNTNEETENVSETYSAPEKIKISLPGSEFKHRAKSPTRRETGDTSWLGSSSNQIFSHSAVNSDQTGDTKQILVPLPKPKGPTRPPPPGGSKPGRPPPPSKPQRPGPPKISTNQSWETFDANSASPARPPPPKKSPARPSPPKRGDGEKPAVTKAAAEDEAAILDSGGGGEKAKKSSKIKPGKAIKVLVHGKDYKEKKEKKEKAKQQQRQLMSKYIKDDASSEPANKEESEEWKKYEEMLGKSDQHIESTKEKLHEMEAGFEGEMSKLWGMPVTTATNKSPWQDQEASVMDAPIDEKHPPKVGWVGFEDDFSKSGGGGDGTKAKGTDESTEDVLGFGIQKESVPTLEASADLLGLGDMNENLEPSVVEESNTTAAAISNDLTDFGLGDNTEVNTHGNDTTSAGLSLVDDFLGISSGTTAPPTLPKDPLEQLKALKTGSIENKDKGGIAETNTEQSELDDIFGFGGGETVNTTESTKQDGGDLFDLGVEDTKPEDPFTVDLDKIQKQTEEAQEAEVAPEKEADEFDDFDPRADISVNELDVKPVTEDAPDWTSPKSAKRERPRPKKAAGKTSDNPFTSTTPSTLLPKPGEAAMPTEQVPNPFADLVGDTEGGATESIVEMVDDSTSKGELLDLGLDLGLATSAPASADTAAVDSGVDLLGGAVTEEDSNFNPFETITDDTCFEEEDMDRTPTNSFDPFQTITEDDKVSPAKDDSFDPFATISGDDAFVAHFPDDSGQELTSGAEGPSRELSPARFNPFDKEPPLDEKFANFEPQTTATPKQEPRKSVESPKVTSESSFTEEEEEELEPLEVYHPPFTGDGWNLYLRLPTGGKKKITQNRYWKPVYVRLSKNGDNPCLRIFNNDKTPEVMQETTFQPSYNLCDMGLQQYDQFGKCHTVKIEQVVYRERVGVKTDRITPTLSDLTRVRDFRGLKDLVHKPKTTMILDHAPQRQELFKFGSLVHEDILTFQRAVENAFFDMHIDRTKTTSYTKDEITVDVVDEYHLDIDKHWHVQAHKARVRLFAISFLSGIPMVEVGINDKRRRGKEVVGRHDIIPIKTEEWVKIEDPEMHYSVDKDEFEKTKVIKFRPLDAARYEICRFRVRPRMNKELPLQVSTVQSLIDRHFEIKSEVLIPGYHSNSRRAAQTPCEDIQIHFPIPEPWIYYFRVEKHFRYGSLHSTTRKPGKIKGLERLTMIAKGILPPNLIEVSTGVAKYEHLFRAIVWRIPRLPERNEGAYKTHLLLLRLDLGPHDPIPTEFATTSHVEFNMPNSTVSRAQVRSISINNPADDPPDRWVKHFAKYSYNVEMDFTDQVKKSLWEETEDEAKVATEPEEGAKAAGLESEHSRDGDIDESDSDSSDSD